MSHIYNLKTRVVDPHHLDADPHQGKHIRIRIQLLVNYFCEFYFPCSAAPDPVKIGPDPH